MPFSPEERYAMACMAMEEVNHNPDLTEVQRNDYAVFASQNMGFGQSQVVSTPIEPEMNQ